VSLDYADPENIDTPPPPKGLEFPGGGGGGFLRPKFLKKHMKFNWYSQRAGGSKIPSVREVWIFSGTTHNITSF